MGFFKNIFNKSFDKIADPKGLEQYEYIAPKIFPYFKQCLPPGGETYPLPEDLNRIDRMKTYDLNGDIVFSNVCDDLNCLYAIDMGDSFDIIQGRHLKEWNVDKEIIHSVAIENYRSLIMKKMSVKGDTNGIMFVIDGNLEAGLVLVDEIWKQLEDQIGEEVIIAVPSRDVIMATGKSNRSMIDAFKATSKEILLNGEYPLSQNLFIRKGEAWTVFEKILD